MALIEVSILLPERKAVLALWDTHRREAEAQQAQARALEDAKRVQAANTAQAPEVAFQPPVRQITPAPTPVYNYSYEGYYPMRYDVIPSVIIWSNGRRTMQEITVPSCFERHHGGDGHWRH